MSYPVQGTKVPPSHRNIPECRMMSSDHICTRDLNLSLERQTVLSTSPLFKILSRPGPTCITTHTQPTMSEVKRLLSPASSSSTPRTKTGRSSNENHGRYALGPSRITFPSSSSSALYASEEGEDPDAYDLRTSGYRASPGPGGSGDGLRGSGDAEGGLRRGETGETQRPGLPKLSRECLWS